VVCRIYETAIPASERKPSAAFREMGRRPDYRWTLARREQAVIGFATVFVPPGESFALLEYLAVDEPFRGGGVGAGLFRAVVADLASRVCPRVLLVEVEADDAGPDADRVQQRRRQDFYRRLGCQRVAGLQYELPLRSAGLPPPMHLFVHGVSSGSPLPRATLEGAIRGIYVDVYGESPTDPRTARMLAAVSDPVGFD
jgi:GNAT superfamily N-acetyltransferase